MPSPIIVGLALRDDDAAPLAAARRLSAFSRLPLTLVTVLPRELPSRVPTPEYARAMRAEAHERLDVVAAGIAGTATVDTLVLAGSPAGAMHELANELGAAAIVVGSSHRGTLGRLLIGDVAAGLLQGSTCPVVVVPRGYEAGEGAFGRVGVAFDGSGESEAALHAAIGFAQRSGGSLHSFTVLEPWEWTPTYIPAASAMTSGADQDRRDWAERTAEKALATVPDSVSGSSGILHGPVAQSLGEVSQDLDLLVCGSRGYGAVQHVLAGSVARGLSHRAACPLVVVPRELSAPVEALWSGSADAPAAPRA